MVPGIGITLGDLCKLTIQLRGLFVVICDGLASMSPKAILVQGVDMDWCSNFVYVAETSSVVSGPSLTYHGVHTTFGKISTCWGED